MSSSTTQTLAQNSVAALTHRLEQLLMQTFCSSVTATWEFDAHSPVAARKAPAITAASVKANSIEVVGAEKPAAYLLVKARKEHTDWIHQQCKYNECWIH